MVDNTHHHKHIADTPRIKFVVANPLKPPAKSVCKCQSYTYSVPFPALIKFTKQCYVDNNNVDYQRTIFQRL